MSNCTFADQSPSLKVRNFSPGRYWGGKNQRISLITLHQVWGHMSGQALADYFNKGDDASSNYNIGDDGKIYLFVDEANRSWCSSSRENDYRAVTVEIASNTTGVNYIYDEALGSAVRLCADICKRNGISKMYWYPNLVPHIRPTTDEQKRENEDTLVKKVNSLKDNEGMFTVHEWFFNKDCPGAYIKSKLDWIVSEVNKLIKDDTPKKMKSSDFVKYVKAYVGKTVYAEGCFGQRLTRDLLDAKKTQYTWYNKKAVVNGVQQSYTNYEYLIQRIENNISLYGADGIGLVKGIIWGYRADGTIGIYQSNGLPNVREADLVASPYSDNIVMFQNPSYPTFSNVRLPNGASVPPGALIFRPNLTGVVSDSEFDTNSVFECSTKNGSLAIEDVSHNQWVGCSLLTSYIDYGEYGIYDKDKNTIMVGDSNIPVVEIMSPSGLTYPRVIQVGSSYDGYLPYNAFRKVTKLDHDSESLKYTYKSLWQKQVISSTVTIRKTIDCLNASGFMMDIFLNRMPEADKVSNAIDAQNTFYAKWDFGIGYMALMYKIQAVAHDKSKYWVSIWAKTNIKSNKGEPNEKYANWANVTGYYTEIGSEGRQSLYVIGKILSSEETVLESPYANDAFKPTFFHNLTNNEAQFSFPYSPKLDRPTHYASSYPRLTIGVVFDGESEHPMMTSVDNMAVTAYYDSIGSLI